MSEVDRHILEPANSTKIRTARSDHQISMVEAIAYSLIILFVAMMALGWFDLMLPWGTS